MAQATTPTRRHISLSEFVTRFGVVPGPNDSLLWSCGEQQIEKTPENRVWTVLDTPTHGVHDPMALVPGIIDDHCFVRIITQRPCLTPDDDIESTYVI